MKINISNKDLINCLLTKDPRERESYHLMQNFIERIQDEAINLDIKGEDVKKIRDFCNVSECSHEMIWANQIINSLNPKIELRKFSAYKYYKKLISIEMKSINYFMPQNNIRAVFVGGGAVPMSSILLAEKYGISSIVLEIDKKVINLSKKLIKTLELSDKIKVINIAGEEFDFKGFDLIIVAVMAGIDLKTKQLILNRIKNTADQKALILARSSYGKIKYIYQSLPKNIFTKFNLLLYVKPYKEVQVSHYIFEN